MSIASADLSRIAPTVETAARRPAATRGQRHRPLGRIRGSLPRRWRLLLGAGGIAAALAGWVAAAMIANDAAIVPSPLAAGDALVKMAQSGVLWTDLAASAQRIGIGYSLSIALGVLGGLAVGSFAAFEAAFEPQFAFLRYIQASALTPLLLLWLGIGESPKIALITLGTVFFNVLMIADAVRNVPRELLDVSLTLGASRATILRRVILRHSLPGIVDACRVNLAAAWLMLVVAELLAAQEGLAFRIVRAQRFRAVDTMFALLIVFGIIGLISDLTLRWLRNATSSWARS